MRSPHARQPCSNISIARSQREAESQPIRPLARSKAKVGRHAERIRRADLRLIRPSARWKCRLRREQKRLNVVLVSSSMSVRKCLFLRVRRIYLPCFSLGTMVWWVVTSLHRDWCADAQ